MLFGDYERLKRLKRSNWKNTHPVTSNQATIWTQADSNVLLQNVTVSGNTGVSTLCGRLSVGNIPLILFFQDLSLKTLCLSHQTDAKDLGDVVLNRGGVSLTCTEGTVFCDATARNDRFRMLRGGGRLEGECRTSTGPTCPVPTEPPTETPTTSPI